MRRTFGVGLGVLLAGCVSLSDFDPVGNAVSIQGQWTIDGEAPTDASCAALGASRIRVTFLDERRPVPHPGLFFSCTASSDGGEAGVFDTAGRRGSGEVVAAGTWTVRLEAIDGTGAVVAIGESAEAVAEAGGAPIVVPVGAFYTGTVSARFAFGDQNANTTTCEAAGVETVALVFDDLGGGAVVGDSSVPCANGAVGARALPGFTYRAHLEALDAEGAVRFATDPQDLSVERGSECRIGGRCQTFCGAGAACPAGEACSGDHCVSPGEMVPVVDVTP